MCHEFPSPNNSCDYCCCRDIGSHFFAPFSLGPVTSLKMPCTWESTKSAANTWYLARIVPLLPFTYTEGHLQPGTKHILMETLSLRENPVLLELWCTRLWMWSHSMEKVDKPQEVPQPLLQCYPNLGFDRGSWLQLQSKGSWHLGVTTDPLSRCPPMKQRQHLGFSPLCAAARRVLL